MEFSGELAGWEECKHELESVFTKRLSHKNYSLPGSRTQLSREHQMTGACTNRYTSKDIKHPTIVHFHSKGIFVLHLPTCLSYIEWRIRRVGMHKSRVMIFTEAHKITMGLSSSSIDILACSLRLLSTPCQCQTRSHAACFQIHLSSTSTLIP